MDSDVFYLVVPSQDNCEIFPGVQPSQEADELERGWLPGLPAPAFQNVFSRLHERGLHALRPNDHVQRCSRWSPR